MSAAYTRPRDPWWPELHRRGGELLLQHLLAGTDVAHVASELAALAASVSGKPASMLVGAA